MPEYLYRDEETSFEKSVWHSISECEKPSEETLKEITIDGRVMKRVIFAPALNGASGKSEKQMLADKKKWNQTRAKAHTINEGYKDIKHADVRAHIEKKKKAGHYDDVKGVDHEKMKINKEFLKILPEDFIEYFLGGRHNGSTIDLILLLWDIYQLAIRECRENNPERLAEDSITFDKLILRAIARVNLADQYKLYCERLAPNPG